MASFIHITDDRVAWRIVRGGIGARPLAASAQAMAWPRRGVYCVPVVADFQRTFQWLRELKRRGYRRATGIQFRIPDAQLVYVGRYRQPPQAMTAAQSVAFFSKTEDPRGFQVVVPRAVEAREITRRQSVPQVIGWRFYPTAKGRPPLWPQPGSINASRLRRRIDETNSSPWDT
jgi:hypothetical protein